MSCPICKDDLFSHIYCPGCEKNMCRLCFENSLLITNKCDCGYWFDRIFIKKNFTATFIYGKYKRACVALGVLNNSKTKYRRKFTGVSRYFAGKITKEKLLELIYQENLALEYNEKLTQLLENNNEHILKEIRSLELIYDQKKTTIKYV